MFTKLWGRATGFLKRSKTFIQQWPHNDRDHPSNITEAMHTVEQPETGSIDHAEQQVLVHVNLSPIIQHEVETALQKYEQAQLSIYHKIDWSKSAAYMPEERKPHRRCHLRLKPRRRSKQTTDVSLESREEAISDAFIAGQMLQATLLKLLTLNEGVTEQSQTLTQMREMDIYELLPVQEGATTLETYWLARQDLGYYGGRIQDADEDYDLWQAEREMFLEQDHELDPSHEIVELRHLAHRETLQDQYNATEARVADLHQLCLDEGIDPFERQEQQTQDQTVPLQNTLQIPINPMTIEQAAAEGRISLEHIRAYDSEDDDSTVADGPDSGNTKNSRIADWLQKDNAPDAAEPIVREDA